MKNTKTSKPMAALINSRSIIISSIMFFGIQGKSFASGARLPFFSTSKNQMASTNQTAATTVKKNVPIVNETTPVSQKTNVYVPDKYAYLDPGHEVPSALLSQALNYYDSHQNIIKNKSVLGIVDFKQHSSKERFYIINIETGQVEKYLVAHGKNSGKEYARSFSNEESSYKSSLGFFITRNTYEGSNGFSLRLEGTENGINNKAMERAIVMHGAGYASESTIYQLGFLGRSWGCPALPESLNKPIINKIKDGNMLFIYYPDQDYLKKSSILNS